MKLYNHLDGQHAAQLLRMLLQKLTESEADTEVTVESQVAYDSDKQRIVFYDGANIRTVAVVEDVYDGQGNTTYLSELEPSGIPDIGLIVGDGWYNLVTAEYRICVNPEALTEAGRWTDVSNVNITYTIPLVAASDSYSNLGVFVYADGAANVSNGNGTMWQNQSGSDLPTPTTISSEADLTTAGFSKIGGNGSSPAESISITLDKAWSDDTHEVGSFSVTKAVNIYTINIPTYTAKNVQLQYATSNATFMTDTAIETGSVTLSFRDAIADNINVTIIT